MSVSFKRSNYTKYLKYFPLIFIITLILVIYFTGIYHQFTFQGIKQKHLVLKTYVEEHPFLSPLIFVGVYVMSVILIIPDSTLLTLLGGYLFPFPLALSLVLFSETLGAYLFFIIIEEAVHPARKSFLKKMSEKFRFHAASYLLFLRWSHIIPYTLINSLAAYFRVKTWTFLWTTFIGLIPLTYLLVEEGRGLAKTFAEDQHFSLSSIINIHVEIAFFIFALLALAPLAYQRWKKKHR
jgi:uncharacterized membrane protein YdjX (TVP38/TMEM64 family)